MDGFVNAEMAGMCSSSPIRIATENTVWRMNDLKQGMFIDAGASFFLPKINNNPALGLYLALTSHQLTGKEALAYGVATHYMPSEKIKQFRQAIADNLNVKHTDELYGLPLRIDKLVEDLAEPVDYKIPNIEEINELFRQDCTIQELFDRLEKSDTFFAQWTLGILKEKNPLAVALTFELLKRGWFLPYKRSIDLEKKVNLSLVIQGMYELAPKRKEELKWKTKVEDTSQFNTSYGKYHSVHEISQEELEWYFNRKDNEPLKYSIDYPKIGDWDK